MGEKKIDTNAEHVRILYPDSLDEKCPACKGKVIHLYPSSKKNVHTFNGKINRIIELYQCSNVDCYLNKKAFNPAPKFDYLNLSYGNDIIQWIAKELFLMRQSVDQIEDRLSEEKNIDIPFDTLHHIADDIKEAKTSLIDSNTLEMIRKQGFIILGLDGKEPKGKTREFWYFKDLITDRVLFADFFSSAGSYDEFLLEIGEEIETRTNYEILHDIIEMIREKYNVPIIGWMSDYQDLIKKCHDEFYSDTPHVYCHYQFLTKVLSYLSALDTKIYTDLKTAITSQKIDCSDDSIKLDCGTHGVRSARKVFEDLNNHLMYLTKATTIKFKQLRGLEIYTQLQEYVSSVRNLFENFDNTHDFTNALFRTLDSLQNELDELKERYLLVDKIWRIFLEICSVLDSEKHSVDIQRQSLKKMFDDLWSLSRSLGCPHSSPEKCKFRNASKNMPEWECVCQMVCVFLSYEPGLFTYTLFPKEIEVNNSLEEGFAKITASFRGQLREYNPSLKYTDEEDERILFIHCDKEELSNEIISDFEKYNIESLRTSKIEMNHKLFTETFASAGIFSRLIHSNFEYQNFNPNLKKGKK